MNLRVSPIKLPSRGVKARANAPVSLQDATDAIRALNSAVQEMRAQHERATAEAAKGRGDVLATEQISRIGEDVKALQAVTEQFSAQLAAVRMHEGTAGAAVNSDVQAHSDAFRKWFKSGVAPSNMNELEIKAALSTDSKPDGGYVVPEEVEQAITRVLGTTSAMRQLATVRTISTGNYKKLHNLGGAGSGWVGEKDTRATTASPTLAELDFPAMEVYAQPAATQNILDDARIDIGQWLGDEVSITFAEQEGAKFVSGDGNKVPYGVLSTAYTKIANSSWAWGKLGFVTTGVAATISDGSNNGMDGLKRLKYALKAGYLPNAGFVMNRNTALLVALLKDTEGQYFWQPTVTAGEASQLLGHPVTQDDNFPDVGANAYPIAFGDFRRGYVIVDRAGISVLRDPFTSKPYVLFYTTKRVGGGVQDFDAIKLLKCST